MPRISVAAAWVARRTPARGKGKKACAREVQREEPRQQDYLKAVESRGCLTERATDMRRARRAEPEEREGIEDEERDGLGRHSVKRSFLRKVLGPVVGYSHDFELLQFVYDLAMRSRIGGGKNACAGLPLRLVLKGETFSPLSGSVISPLCARQWRPGSSASRSTNGSWTKWKNWVWLHAAAGA